MTQQRNSTGSATRTPPPLSLARRLGRSALWTGGSVASWLVVLMLLRLTWPTAPSASQLYFAIGCLSAGVTQGVVWWKGVGALDFQASWTADGSKPWLFVLACLWSVVIMFLLLTTGLLLMLCLLLLPHYGENFGWN